MGALLAVADGMRTLGLFITLLAVTPQAVTDQKLVVPEGTIITSAQVTGFDIGRLSPGLRRDIRNLAGTPLNQHRLDELAARIESERPRYVAAVRSTTDTSGQAWVFFVVGRRDQPDRVDTVNINDQYIVEKADITGVPDAELTQTLRDDLQAIVGKRLDSPEANELQQRLANDLPKYEVSRRLERGSERGRIQLVYEARKKEPPSWLRFVPLRSNVVYHSDQGWGSFLELDFGDRAVRVSPILAFASSEDFVEEYSGYGVRVEARKLGTRRLGASFEWSRFEPDWRSATLDALAFERRIPAPYATRTTFTPLVRFAFTPTLSVAGGVSLSELELLAPATGEQMANAVVASIEFNQRWTDGGAARHEIDAGFGVRAGSRELESDLSYRKYLGQGSYRYDFGRHHIQATGMAGKITGDAPLFERFALGDSTTLRGWDKYDIAPAGGDRVAYSSIEYRYSALAFFLDLGSVWDVNSERRVRVSSGFGLRAGPAFFLVGFPLNTDNVRAVFTMGLRVSGVGARW